MVSHWSGVFMQSVYYRSALTEERGRKSRLAHSGGSKYYARELNWWHTLKHVWTGFSLLISVTAAHSLPRRIWLPWSRRLSSAEGPLQAWPLGQCVLPWASSATHFCLPYKSMKVNLYVFFCPLDSQSMIINILTWERWSKYEQKLPNTCELTYFYSMSVALTFFLTLIMVLFTRI